MEKINNFLKTKNIKTKNIKLYEMAFTHPSFSNEHPKFESYQKLEFLGDAIIAKQTALWIFNNLKNMNEGKMSILKNSAISSKSLNKFALKEDLHKYVRFGKGIKTLRNNKKILADVFEALVAAIFLDKGIKAVDNFFVGNLYKYLRESANKNLKNAKTILQELIHAKMQSKINYVLNKKDKLFNAKIFINNNLVASGKGKSKKDAEISAAKLAIKRIENNETN